MFRWLGTKNSIRLGIIALPASGLLVLVSSLAPEVFINPRVDPAAFAQAYGSTNFPIGNPLGIVASVLLLIGFQALHSFLTETTDNKWALARLLMTIAGIGLFLPFIGIFAFAAPVAGRLYLNGDKDAIRVIADSTDVSSLPVFLFGGLSILLLVIGAVLFAIAIWQSHRLPRWSGILYIVSVPLDFVPSYNFLVTVFGSLLLLAAGVWIALSILKVTAGK